MIKVNKITRLSIKQKQDIMNEYDDYCFRFIFSEVVIWL